MGVGGASGALEAERVRGQEGSAASPQPCPRAQSEQPAGGRLPTADPATPVLLPGRLHTPATQALVTWANTSSHGPGLSPPRISRETQLSKKVATTVANCSTELRLLP